MSRKSDDPKRNIIAIKLSGKELAALDELARRYTYHNRSAIVRMSLKYAAEHLDHEIDECRHKWIPISESGRDLHDGKDAEYEVCLYCHEIRSTDIPF